MFQIVIMPMLCDIIVDQVIIGPEFYCFGSEIYSLPVFTGFSCSNSNTPIYSSMTINVVYYTYMYRFNQLW